MFSERGSDMRCDVLVLVGVRLQSSDMLQIGTNILVEPAATTGLWLMHTPSPFFPFPLSYISFHTLAHSLAHLSLPYVMWYQLSHLYHFFCEDGGSRFLLNVGSMQCHMPGV